MGFQNPVVGGTALRIPAIQSPNYNPGVAGWIIKIDGSAEFNNLTIRGTFEGNDFVLDSDGLFIYSGTPAAGNLIASITPTSGTDSFGNTYLGGINTYSGASFVGLNVGNLLLGLTADSSKAGVVGLVGGDGIAGISPFSTANPDTSGWQLQDGDRTTTPTSASGFPHAMLDGTVWVRDAIVQATDNANVWTAETWHTPTFSGSWVTTGTLNGNSTFRGLQYRKDAEDNVWVLGAATTTAAGGSVFTLPSGYFNSSRRHLLPCFIFDSSAAAVVSGFAQVTEAGVVNIAASLTGVTIASGDQIFINGKFPLGNVG